MNEEQHRLDERDHFDERQLMLLSISTRAAAVISLVCSVYMAQAAWRQRTRLYHRIIFCLSCHLMMYSLWNLYGSAAIPADTPNSWGAVGTVRTCTAEGFGIQLSYTVPFYYVFLSLYSYVAVGHNFNVTRYAWVEPWIHLGAHIFPVVSALYVWHIQAFNYGGNGLACWINSLPLGCGDDSGVPCTRGPENISFVTWIHAGLPICFVLVFPTCVILALYCRVRKRQDTIQLQANTVASQGACYLCALYWSYLFAAIHRESGRKYFGLGILAAVNLNLLGFWMLLIYLHFRRNPSHAKRQQNAEPTVSPSSNEQAPKQPRAFEFSIFDGSNPVSELADFVFAGDELDEAEDLAETHKWADIQQHL